MMTVEQQIEIDRAVARNRLPKPTEHPLADLLRRLEAGQVRVVNDIGELRQPRR